MTDSDKEKLNLPVAESEATPTSKPAPEVGVTQQYRDLAGDLGKETPPGFKPESEKQEGYKQRLLELHKEELGAFLTEEDRGEVDRMKEEIDQLFTKANESAIESEKPAETETINESNDPELIRRLARDVEMIGVIEKLDQLDIAEGDSQESIEKKLDKKRNISSMIERRRWGKVFGKLQEGDKVVTVIVPGADFLKIKNLNDKIFGYSGTTEILEYRKKLIEEQLVKIDGQKAEILKTDYQSSTIKLPKGVSEDYLGTLKDKLKIIDGQMTAFIESKIQSELKKYENDPGKKEVLIKFEKELTGKSDDEKGGRAGYRMTFGVADVQGEAMEEKLNALNRSTQAARTARGLKEEDGADSYGAEYGREIISNELDSLRDLRENLRDKSISNKEGTTFKLFERVKAGEAEYLVLNKDVLRDVRKDKFIPEENSRQILADVIQYVKKINIIDSVKPFTKAEAVGGELEKQRQDSSDLTAAFLNLPDIIHDSGDARPENEEEKRTEIRREVSRVIKTEEKDGNYSSADQFHAQAIKIKKCAYLSIDVMDLGVDQLLEFERRLQEVEIESGGDKDKRQELLDQKALEAGDEATEKMRTVRGRIKEVLGKYGLLMSLEDNKFGKEGVVLAKLGGDELDLAIDREELDKKGMSIENLMFEIKEATNHGMADVRIIKTVAAEATRDSTKVNNQSETDIIKDHLITIKRAEIGAEIAKGLEENVRKLNLMIKQKGAIRASEAEKMIAEAGLEKIFKFEDGLIKSFVIITEKNGVFDVKTRGSKTSEIDTMPDSELQQRINKLKIEIAHTEAIAEDELRKDMNEAIEINSKSKE